MKKIIIASVVVIVLCAGLLLYLYVFKKPAEPAPGGSTIVNYEIKPLPQPQIPAGETVTLNTGKGPVTVKNFYKTAEKIIEASVYLTDNKNYTIAYFTRGNYFLIGLNAYTGAEANIYRQTAEQDLMSKLGIGPDSACKLAISEQIPQSYNSDLSATDYHFSYCQDGLKIPQENSPDPAPNIR